jgi:hypothetical protein
VARAKLFAVITAALVTAGCGGAASEPTRPEAGAVARPPKTFSVGSTLVGLGGEPVKLAAPPVTPLAGWLTPAGVPSPDGRYLAYNTWRELRHDDPQLSWSDQGIEPGDRLATPSVRVFDTEDDSDELLEDGAFSLAWRSDGAVAYFRGAERDYRAAVSYVGDVVVRASLDAKPEVWSPTRGRYIVVAWAGDRLVAYREHAGEALDVVVFEGPGRMRVIAPDSALVALSPDGQQAFVEQGPAQGRPSVGVVELASGETVAELDLTKVDRRVGTVSYAGDWLGRRVVAPSATGLAVFRVGAASITLDRTFEVEVPQGLAEPRFADSSGRRITAWASEGRGGFFLDCGVESGACERVVPYPAARRQRGFPTWRRPLYNPSRPQ